jgi:hypothetical protein
MPTAALHSNYWAGSADAPAAAAETVLSHYPAWQATVITPSLFGSFQIVYEWLARKAGK